MEHGRSEPPLHPSDPSALRLAYFVTSYGSGEQLFRLVRTMRRADPDAEIVVHHDELHHPLDVPALEALGVHVLLAEESIVWGDMTLETARWRVFRWILDHLDVDWVMLLSEQDYPVTPLRTLRERLAGTAADAVIEAERADRMVDPARRREIELRYRYQYVSMPHRAIERLVPARLRDRYAHLRGLAITALSRLQRRVFVYSTPPELDLPNRIGIRDLRSPFTDAFPCWYNSCWCALSRRSLERVLAYVDSHPAFVRYYEHTVIPVESATATILCNDPDIVVENATLHAIRWSGETSGRPEVFRSDDIDYLTSAGVPFARKFGTRDTAVLDALDSVVLGTTTHHDGFHRSGGPDLDRTGGTP